MLLCPSQGDSCAGAKLENWKGKVPPTAKGPTKKGTDPQNRACLVTLGTLLNVDEANRVCEVVESRAVLRSPPLVREVLCLFRGALLHCRARLLLFLRGCFHPARVVADILEDGHLVGRSPQLRRDRRIYTLRFNTGIAVDSLRFDSHSEPFLVQTRRTEGSSSRRGPIERAEWLNDFHHDVEDEIEHELGGCS